MNSDNKLERCPFCSGVAHIWEVKALAGNKLYEVICAPCKAKKGYFKTQEEAIEVWNRRIEFKATDAWYQKAADEDLYMETADIKPCPHNYVFWQACPVCVEQKVITHEEKLKKYEKYLEKK